jgi:hypothetical protein
MRQPVSAGLGWPDADGVPSGGLGWSGPSTLGRPTEDRPGPGLAPRTEEES